MSKQALLNVNLLAARKGAAELEFAVKKVHSLDSSRGGPEGYVKAIENRVEKIVLEEINKFQNEDNFLSTLSQQTNNSNVTWILKPIDGVSNFINGYPHFSLTLCSKIDDEIVTAVIIDPIRREEFSAYSGGSADLNNNKIRASKQTGLDGAIISFVKPNSKTPHFDFDSSYKELANQKLDVRQSGCLSLDLAYIGSGRLDAIWSSDTNIIDMAAGSLIAQEGGSLVSNFEGDPKYINGSNIIAASPKVYKSVLKSIKPYYKK
tara:strand:+ start:849 stop:1637 length:789 start_codon:yes stop_codon:yes gene_type:complete